MKIDIQKGLKGYLWILLLKFVVRFSFPDAFSASSLAGLDHDRVTDLLSMMQTFFQRVNTTLKYNICYYVVGNQAKYSINIKILSGLRLSYEKLPFDTTPLEF
jgi:hypothetical protein